MIAVDANLLVYAHRRDAPFHERAAAAIREVAEGAAPWAIPWPCAHEFVAIVTHPGFFDPPSTLAQAFDQLAAWSESPSQHFIGETSGHLDGLRDVAVAGGATGPKIHDARVAAICLAHAVSRLWTVDRDFSRFPSLRVGNPLTQRDGS